MQAERLWPAGALAWLVYDALPALAFQPPNGRADQTLWEKGEVEAGEAVRG